MLRIIKNIFSKKLRPGPEYFNDELNSLGIELKEHVSKVFGRSLAVRELDSGSDNAAEIEINNLSTPHYDISRFGVDFVASPRHADVILITGAITLNMKNAVLATYNATPRPCWIIAVGDDAYNGGVVGDSYAVLGGADKILPVDFKIPGNPPVPSEIMRGLVAFMKLLREQKTSKSSVEKSQ
jgi:Ni,Fe-hydrogenase III small subunit